MDYRPEIDGLRALAVVPVIFFHAGFETFNGGYVGVDVFFVISGYLITTILLEDLENERFSILDFYERRARRILPALLFMMFVCIPFAWIWMIPNQMKDFSESLIAVSLFISNIYFWRESGYFETVAEEKPLLHTWSLSVEEQFYALFPIFLLIFFRLGKDKAFWSIVVIAFISFLLSEWGRRSTPVANFYLAPTRAWELLVGAAAAFIVLRQGVKNNNVLAQLGLLFVVCSIFMYDTNTPFPSVFTLVPVFGVLLLILYAGQPSITAQVLGSKLFVGTGLISYSAYLWHQPIFAFAKIKFPEYASNVAPLLMISLTFAMAFLSWKFIEQPFRNRSKISRKRIFQYSTLGSAFLIIFGFWGYESDGFKSEMLKYKYSETVALEVDLVSQATDYDMYENMATDECSIWVKNTKEIDQIKFEACEKKHGKALIILGDSHAMNLFNIFSYSKAYDFVIGVSQGGCRAHHNLEMCHYNDFKKFAALNSEAVSLIIYHQSGSHFIKDDEGRISEQTAFDGNFGGYVEENIAKTALYLKDLVGSSKSKVLWIGPFLEYRREPNDELFKETLYTVNSESIRLFRELNILLSYQMNTTEMIDYLKFDDLFFEPKKSFIDDCFLFRDSDHFSKCGEKVIAKSLKKGLIDDAVR